MSGEPQPVGAGRIGLLVWTNLPVLLVASLPVAAGWSVLRQISPSVGPLTVLAAAVLVLPGLTALLAGVTTLIEEEHFGLADLLRALGRSLRPLVCVAGPLCLSSALTLVALEGWQSSGRPWMLISLALGTVATLGGTVGAVVALPYLLRTGVSAREGWLVACFVATRSPVPVLAALSALALSTWTAAHLSFALLILIPAPLALVWSSAVGSALTRSQSLLDHRTSPVDHGPQETRTAAPRGRHDHDRLARAEDL